MRFVLQRGNENNAKQYSVGAFRKRDQSNLTDSIKNYHSVVFYLNKQS